MEPWSDDGVILGIGTLTLHAGAGMMTRRLTGLWTCSVLTQLVA